MSAITGANSIGSPVRLSNTYLGTKSTRRDWRAVGSPSTVTPSTPQSPSCTSCTPPESSDSRNGSEMDASPHTSEGPSTLTDSMRTVSGLVTTPFLLPGFCLVCFLAPPPAGGGGGVPSPSAPPAPLLRASTPPSAPPSALPPAALSPLLPPSSSAAPSSTYPIARPPGRAPSPPPLPLAPLRSADARPSQPPAAASVALPPSAGTSSPPSMCSCSTAAHTDTTRTQSIPEGNAASRRHAGVVTPLDATRASSGLPRSPAACSASVKWHELVTHRSA
mmetsp:Transcript_13418/g.31699  ORF Transcript_13418/g.31699 Transcript_13418/m.31699 type:complete len:277 (-) Transcript_13418:229-1059(-)